VCRTTRGLSGGFGNGWYACKRPPLGFGRIKITPAIGQPECVGSGAVRA